MVLMDSKKHDFSLSGPLHLSFIDWTNSHHRRSVAASLVQDVYILERDRQLKRQGAEALAPPWWEFFHFHLLRQLVDDADSSIFGAIYEFKPPTSHCHQSIDERPRYIIAFRGIIPKPDSLSRDLELGRHLIGNGLHETTRFEIAIGAVRNAVATVGKSNVWLAGHSLGAAMALLAGKTMAKTGIVLQAFLFNSPFVSAPLEIIKDERVKKGIRIVSSVIKAGTAFVSEKKYQNSGSVDPFAALSEWIPYIFVNPGDHICSWYIGYFKHRKTMDAIGIGAIEKLATQHSLAGLLMSAVGKGSEPFHLIPSANLVVNISPAPHFMEANGIYQWWRPDLTLQCKAYNYK
ncbi:hypothetical protein K2173_010311 [Erythroxylum novogranatense]|uniref:Fungal lipase-type domain-containing protein n=1 Tax=Erythroxylum novogranatense TaxID=1862640 RepID=A0AAV8TDC0_9ROSI|nr:hypothetical protein K2173_010311 [Erythroxylum novogranatense]